ncbi:ABC transporter ATP-binding protein [Nocardioidaceae bacterium SCSIO 66511]|nr:ABC transporter ATP-binding protein [Nocardioidaceae bacterium SCSIO 66511]
MSLTMDTQSTVTSDAITFDGIGKHYDRSGERLQVLQDCSFEISEGEFVSVIGPSGCGKTTLLGMAAGFTHPDNGQVRVGSQVVREPHSSRGVVFQQYAVFPWLTVAQNIGYGLTLRANRVPRKQRHEIVAHYVEQMGLTGFEDVHPKDLSGGMRQRVAIARAYATNPRVLLMDEPFAALDAQTREHMQELLHETQLEEQRTALFITHSVEEAIYLSNRVVVLSNRPAKVREVIDIPIDAPRTPDTRLARDFVDLRRDIERLLRDSSAERSTA